MAISRIAISLIDKISSPSISLYVIESYQTDYFVEAGGGDFITADGFNFVTADA